MCKKYLCMECGEIYDSENINKKMFLEDVPCPKSSCYGYLVEIDELLLPTIKILNEKGYFTKFCCSGHYSSQNPRCYIMFDEGICLPYIPNGFKENVISNCVCIESGTLSDVFYYDDFLKICDNAKLLLEWAIKLPDYEEV